MAIELEVRFEGPETLVELQAYPLRVEVLNAVDMSAKIFVFKRRVASATDSQANAQGDLFIQVANPIALEQYPEDSPDLANNMPYYRLAAVDLAFNSVAELDESRDLIDAAIQALVTSMKALADIPVQETKTYA